MVMISKISNPSRSIHCKARIWALIMMSSGSVGSKHHFSNDGREGGEDVEDVEEEEADSRVPLVHVDARVERARSLCRIVSSGSVQKGHKHLNP